MHWIPQTLDCAASVPHRSYKCQSSSKDFQFHNHCSLQPWETTTRGQLLPWMLFLHPLYILGRSNVSHQLRNHSDLSVLSTRLPSRLDTHHFLLTAPRMSTMKRRKKTSTPSKRVGHVSAYHRRPSLYRTPDPSSRFPFL
jgi:hypothetical protein